MKENTGDPLDSQDRPVESADAEPASPTIPSERYDLKILQALRKVIRGVAIHSRRLVATHEITAPQLICLITIAADGPLTLKEIAQRVYLGSSTVVGILDRLESKGLVLRARDTRDRRLVNVTVTARGRELVKNAPSPLQEGLARSLKALPQIEQATIALALQRIVDLMEVEALDAAPLLDTEASFADGSARPDDGSTNTGSETDQADEDDGEQTGEIKNDRDEGAD